MLDPEDRDNHLTLGTTLYRSNRFDDALRELEIASAGCERNLDVRPSIFAFLTMTHARLGHMDKAFAELEKLRELTKLKE